MRFKEIEIPGSLREVDDLSEVRSALKTQSVEIDASFAKFAQDKAKVVEEAKKLLTETIDSDPVSLEETISSCLAYSYSVGEAFNDAEMYVLIYEVLNHHPKTKELSETDRKKLINFRNFSVIRVYNALKLLVERLDKKISVCQSILKKQVAMIQKDTYHDQSFGTA